MKKNNNIETDRLLLRQGFNVCDQDMSLYYHTPDLLTGFAGPAYWEMDINPIWLLCLYLIGLGDYYPVETFWPMVKMKLLLTGPNSIRSSLLERFHDGLSLF